LKAYKIRAADLEIKKDDWPKFVREEPEVYEDEELDALFAKCDAEERLWFEFFLMTGFRDQEVMHAFWSDINFKASTVRVKHKPEYNWTPKAYKEREVPIPAKLAGSLKAWKEKNGTSKLLFPNASGRPRGDFLERLKRMAVRAGLDQELFWLHKFRATFATKCLWGGVDLTTLQLWLGHDDLKSTMRYLKPSRSQKVRDKVNEIFA
jgi:integrase